MTGSRMNACQISDLFQNIPTFFSWDKCLLSAWPFSGCIDLFRDKCLLSARAFLGCTNISHDVCLLNAWTFSGCIVGIKILQGEYLDSNSDTWNVQISLRTLGWDIWISPQALRKWYWWDIPIWPWIVGWDAYISPPALRKRYQEWTTQTQWVLV